MAESISQYPMVDKFLRYLQVEKNNKAAGTRARKAALELSKLLKDFRKVSVEEAKK